jgi:hypothetical protein
MTLRVKNFGEMVGARLQGNLDLKAAMATHPPNGAS